MKNFTFLNAMVFPRYFALMFFLGVMFGGNVWGQTWTYDFGTGTGSHTSTTASTSFLPSPTSGTSRVRVGTNPGSISLVNPGIALGTGSELQISSNTGSTSTTKFSVYDYTPSKSGYVKFKIAFNGGTDGVYNFTIGDGTTFSDNNGMNNSHIFSGIRWSLLTSNAVTYQVLNNTTWGTTGISNSTTLFSQSTSNEYLVEIYYNNTTGSLNYDRTGSTYSVANAKWDLWVDGTLRGDDLAKAALGTDVNIDSYAFNHQVSALAPGTIYIDDIEYSNALPAAITPTLNAVTLGSALASSTYGTASAGTSFTAAGTNLTGNITVTAQSGFEVSTASGSGYGASVSVASGTTVWVRTAATRAAGAFNSTVVVVLSGGGASSNANVTSSASNNSVSQKDLTITGLSATNKTYDGTTTVTVTDTPTYEGLVNGESFSVSGSVSWVFPDANVGDNKILTRTGSYNAPSANYTLTQPSLTANITPKALTITANNVTKTAGVLLSGSSGSTAFSSDGLVGSQTIGSVSIAYGSAGATTGDGAIPGTYLNQVSPSNAVGGTFSASDYDITYVSGSITVEEAPANPTINVSGELATLSTTYGTPSSNTSFSVSGLTMNTGITITPPVGFEVATTSNFSTTIGTNSSPLVIGSAGTIANTTIYVRLSGTAVVLGSPYLGNITLSSSGADTQTIAAVSSTVSEKELTISGLSATNKVYDGTTTVTVTGTPTYVGLENGESFSVSGSPSWVFATKTVGTAKTINQTGTYAAPSSNYTVTQPILTSDITAKQLTITGISITDKPFDNTTVASILGTASLVGVVLDDVVTLGGIPVATFGSVNVGNNIAVTVSGYTISGTDAANYSLQQPQGLTGNIVKANQTITFGALPDKTTADDNFALTATTSSGLGISYSSSNTEVATIEGSTVTIIGAGQTTITASQAGDGNYNAATSVSQNLVVTLAPVILGAWQFGDPASLGNETTYNATTTAGNLNAITLTRGEGIAATALGRGFASNGWDADATKAGAISNNEYFEFVISSITNYNFSISTLNARLRRSGATAPNAYIWKYSLDGVNFSDIGTDVSFTSTADGADQSQISLSGISALQNAKTVTFRLYAWGGTSGTATFSIGRFGTGVTSNSLAIGGNVFADILPPTLSSDETANTVDNNIDITFTDNDAWRNAITAVKIGSTSLTPDTDYVITAGNIQLKPSGLNGLLTASGSKSVTVVATGYSDATVTQAIDPGVPTTNSTATIDSILAPNVTRTITCTAKDQYNNLVSGYIFKYDAAITSLDATTAESYTIDGTAITSTSNNVSLVSTTNASGVATFTVVMPPVLDANDGLGLQVQLADGSTNIGSAFAYLELPGQTITFGALSAVIYGDDAFTLSATGGDSGNPVVFTSSNASIATCTGTNGTTLTIIGAGTVTIHANQAASAGYNAAAEVSQSLVVNQKGLTITGLTGVNRVYDGTTTATFTGTPAYVGLAYGQSFSVSGTASAVFFDANVGTGKTITVSGYTVPSNNYTLTQPTLTADITQASQTISFGTLPNRVEGGATFTLPLNASSTLAISYASSDTNVATVSGNTVTIVGVGTTTITASQAGNSNYAAATSVNQDLTVIATPIAGWDFFGQNNIPSLAATTLNLNLTSGGITRGPAAVSNSAINSFSTLGFQNDGISTANNDYFQITLTPVAGYETSLSAINANFDGTATFYASPGVTSQYAYSLDGTNFTLIDSPVTSVSLKPAAVDLTGISALQNVLPGTTITIRYYASGQTTTGGWRFSSPALGVLGLAIGGSVDLIPTNNWTGAISTSWNNPGNWSLSQVPLSTDNITISTGTPILDVNHTIDAGRTLTLSGTGTLTLNPNAILTIAGGADFGGKSVTLKSDASGTAAIGQVTGTLTGATNVTAERYIPAKRAWRLLTAPLKGSGGSIFANWQGTNNEGLLLWNPAGTASPSSQNTGLYLGPQPNIWSYTGTAWSAVANTNDIILFDANENKAFLVFATGPHGSENITSGAAATTTRANGSLITGNVEHTLTANQFKLIGNPYASPINTETLVSGNNGSKIWLLDPSNGLGTYVSYDGQNWSIPTPEGNDKFIQSGQAFFVRSTTTAFTINEMHKVSGNSNTWFERNANNIVSSESSDKIRVLLYKQVANNWQFADGALAVNSSNGSNEVDATDAGKISNFNESLMFRNGTSNLSIEYRALPEAGTTQPLRLTSTTVQPYQFRLYVENYSNSNLQPFLEDTQTETFTAIPTDGSEVIVPFTGVVSNASNPDNRFRIVYETVLSSDQPTVSNFRVYPNPVLNGQFNIDFETLPTNASYTLTTLLGQQIQKGTLSNTQNPISLDQLAKGIYLLQISQDDKVMTKKLYIH